MLMFSHRRKDVTNNLLDHVDSSLISNVMDLLPKFGTFSNRSRAHGDRS